MRDLNNTHNIKVLMYHRVIEDHPEKYNHWHYVTVSEFRRQLKFIGRLGYTPITFRDYHLFKSDKLTLPSKPIIISFDDGYMDTFQNAIPIMKEMGMKGVIFVLGDRKQKRAKWDEKDESDICPLMTDKQLQIANKMGFEIGSHSMHHIDLSDLSDSDAIYTIQQSKAEIEAVIQEPIYSFAYPYGKFNKRIEQIVCDSGYSYACGVYTGSPKFGETLFDFRRLAINQNTSLQAFAIKLITPFQYIEWIYNQIKSTKENTIEEVNKAKQPKTLHTNGKSTFSESMSEQNA